MLEVQTGPPPHPPTLNVYVRQRTTLMDYDFAGAKEAEETEGCRRAQHGIFPVS